MKRARAVRVEGDLAYVELTRGLFSVIDASDAPLVGQKCWHAAPCRGKFYARAHFFQPDGRDETWCLQRFLLNPPKGFVVDHINGDMLDNRRANLRLATNAENARNVAMRASNTSGFKGVTWHKNSQTWRAQIKIDKKHVSLGAFNDPLEAHKAYCLAAAEIHGQFANFGSFQPLKSQEP